MENILEILVSTKFRLKDINKMSLYGNWYLKNKFPDESIISIFSFIPIKTFGIDGHYESKLGILVQFENWLLEMAGNKKEDVRKINLKYSKGEIIWDVRFEFIVLWK